MIVVIDTNVWISAFVFSKPHSAPERVLDRAVRRDTLATSRELRDETFRILTEKYRWTSTNAMVQIDRFHCGALLVTLHHNVHVCRDPQDDMFLECAAVSNADVLVTGDKDLLALGSYAETLILTPSQYLELPG